MKYITTDTHPELKEGLLIEETAYNSELFSLNTCRIQLPLEADLSIEQWVEKGYIKEVQEKEWTDDDMEAFALDYIKNYKAMSTSDQLKMYKSK